MHNTVSDHFSGHRQIGIPEPMIETIQIIQLHSFFFKFSNVWMGA